MNWNWWFWFIIKDTVGWNYRNYSIINDWNTSEREQFILGPIEYRFFFQYRFAHKGHRELKQNELQSAFVRFARKWWAIVMAGHCCRARICAWSISVHWIGYSPYIKSISSFIIYQRKFIRIGLCACVTGFIKIADTSVIISALKSLSICDKLFHIFGISAFRQFIIWFIYTRAKIRASVNIRPINPNRLLCN